MSETANATRIKDIDRWLSKVKVVSESGCWVWQGCTHDGYGWFRMPERAYLAHQWGYTHIFGSIPSGLQLDHTCRNRACCNPLHTEPVTRKVNILRGESPSARNARKTECLNGHPFDESNTRQIPTGGRYCRACDRLRKPAIKRRGRRDGRPILHQKHSA